VADAARIIAAAWEQDEDWGTLVWLVMVTGMRRGEVLALRWADVDLELGVLTIRRNYVRTGSRGIEKDTKTHQMRRISLDAQTVAVLGDHRARWEQQARSLGIEPSVQAFLFSRQAARDVPADPSAVTHRYGACAQHSASSGPLGAGLERSYLVHVRGRLKFRVKQIVYVAFSLDESVMGSRSPRRSGRRWWRASRTSSGCRRRRICASTGSTPTSLPWIRPRPASSSSTPGAWSCPRSSPAPTTSPVPTVRADARTGGGPRHCRSEDGERAVIARQPSDDTS
jgi:hypothetical protein